MCCSAAPADQWWNLVLDWVPFIAFMGILIYVMKKSIFGKQAEHIEQMRRYYTEHLEETRKISTSLSRIAAALESRGDQRG